MGSCEGSPRIWSRLLGAEGLSGLCRSGLFRAASRQVFGENHSKLCSRMQERLPSRKAVQPAKYSPADSFSRGALSD
jgi:hypothetical protein